MIAETWGGFFEIAMLGIGFFAAGWLWRHESSEREYFRRQAIRRAHHHRREKAAGR